MGEEGKRVSPSVNAYTSTVDVGALIGLVNTLTLTVDVRALMVDIGASTVDQWYQALYHCYMEN